MGLVTTRARLRACAVLYPRPAARIHAHMPSARPQPASPCHSPGIEALSLVGRSSCPTAGEASSSRLFVLPQPWAACLMGPSAWACDAGGPAADICAWVAGAGRVRHLVRHEAAPGLSPDPRQFCLQFELPEEALRARRPAASHTQSNEEPGEKRAQPMYMCPPLARAPRRPVPFC